MIKKRFLKTKCKVTFEVVEDAMKGVQAVCLVGDFNDWNQHASPMQRKKSKFTITLNLEPNRANQYRYLINQGEWQNDEQADAYTPNPFNSHNSVLLTYPTDSTGAQ